MQNQHKDQLKELAKLFEQAEMHVKKTEDINGGIVIPSINELRYFGYHILKALIAEEDRAPELVNNEIEKAKGHAKRAIYDASEALIVFYLEKAANFHTRHENSACITDVLPNYVEDLQQLEQIKSEIKKIRDDEQAYKNRDAHYEKCLPFIESLGTIISRFDQANPLIIKKERQSTRTFIIQALGLVFGIIAAIAAIIALV
jgi:DNA repair exonuclease SbcCD ATPase subunit